MGANLYAGVIEDWKFDLMVARARRMGFRGDDLEDALQNLAMEVIAFRYDPERARGRKESTVLTELFDFRLRDMRRKQQRDTKRDDLVAKEQRRNDTDFAAAERISSKAEISILSETLAPFDQKVLEQLLDGKSISDIAAKLDCRWHTARDSVKRIEEKLRQKGLIPPGYEDNV